MNEFFDSSRRKILNQLLHEDLNAVQLAKRLDLGVTTVREHLRKLKEKGYIEHYFKKAKRGRPKKKYTITNDGIATFPKKYRFILSHLLRRLEPELGTERLHKLLDGVGSDIADIDEDLLKEDLDTRIKELIKFRRDLDLHPSMSKKEDGSYILEHKNCGSLNLDKDVHGHICHICRRIISQFLPECKVEQLKSFGEGDDACIHKITP